MARKMKEAPRAEENVYAFPWKPLRTVSKRFGGGGDKTRNRVLRPRGGRNSGKHAEMDVFNPTPGTPICQGSELHPWSELLPLIVKLYSLGLAQDSKHARASAAPRKNATVGLGAHQEACGKQNALCLPSV